MIFLILLLAVCDAVNLNSNYFKSDFIVPTDCTIQPTQQECIKYAQLTMQQEVALVEVSSGQPATLYMEVSSGSAAVEGSPEWMSESECEQYTTDNGYASFSYSTTTERPPGCWYYAVTNQIYWNHHATGTTCDQGPCIQKSPTAAAYVTESECAALSPYGGPFGATSGTFPLGCIKTTTSYYWNPDAGDAGTACGTESYNCVQKHSYYNFGHVEVPAGLPALESDIRYVGEKECQVYGESIGKWNTAYSVVSWNNAVPKGCYICGSSDCTGNYEDLVQYNTASPTHPCGNRAGDNCIQRDVITHHAAAEGCLSDGKVRWNIPFIEVTSGAPATLYVEVSSGSPDLSMSESECEQYATSLGLSWGIWDTTNNYGVNYAKGCLQPNVGDIRYNKDTTNHLCGTDTGSGPVNCIQKSSTAAAYVSEDECKNYAESIGQTWDTANSEVSWSGVPKGCYMCGSSDCTGVYVNLVQYNTASHEIPCGNRAGDNCIQKPITELPCAPHQCICKRGNVATTTYQAGTLSDRFFEYVEVSVGSPAVEGSAYVTESECHNYALKYDYAWNPSYTNTANPSGCFKQYSTVYFGTYSVSEGAECGAFGVSMCIQKITKTHQLIKVTTGAPASGYVEVISGSPVVGSPEWVSENECKLLHGTTVQGGGIDSNGIVERGAGNYDWHGTLSQTVNPAGCFYQRSTTTVFKLYYNRDLTSTEPCGNPNYSNCIQKSPTFDAYVSESECEAHSGANWGGQVDIAGEIKGCYIIPDTGMYYFNTDTTSTALCSLGSRACIQKAPFHGKSVQSIVKQAIDAVLNAEMHYAESVNVFIEDFDHPKTTASDTLYTKQAAYEVTDFNFLYSTITANQEWRPAIPFNTLEEAKASCSADSSNCLGVTHRRLDGTHLYLRHNGNSNLQLASYEQEHDERLYFQLLDRPFFIRFPIDASTVSNDLKALCDSYPSCFARGNYVNTHDAEWDSSNYPGDGSGNYIAVFYKQFQLQQATKVNAVYRSLWNILVTSGSAAVEGSAEYVTEAECVFYAQQANLATTIPYSYAPEPHGCWKFSGNSKVYFNSGGTSSGCSSTFQCIQRGGVSYVSVDTLYEAFQGCEASTLCEGITGYQEVTIGAAATQTVLLDQDLLVTDGDDFQLIVYDFQTGDCTGSGGDYTVTTYADKGIFHVLQACHRGGSTENPVSFFGKRVLKKTAVATETCSEDCTSLGYKVSQMTDSGIRYIQVTSGAPLVSTHARYVNQAECEQYGIDMGYNDQNGVGIYSFNDAGYPSGCFFKGSNPVYIYFNSNVGSTATCSESSDMACVQKVHDANCLCTQKVRASGHNIKTDCFPGFELKEEVVQVSSGSPALEGSAEYITETECSTLSPYGGAFGATSGTFPIGCIKTTTYYWNPDAGDAGTACGTSTYNCIQKRKACEPCPAGTTIAMFSLVTSGAPDMSVSDSECEQYAISNGLTWYGLYSGTSNPDGCFLQYSTVYYNANGGSCSVNPNSKCIQKATSGCNLCPAGSDSVPYSSECFTCPDGESSIPGGRCTNCLAGQFQVGGSGCTDCTSGYQDENGAAACKDCPIGSLAASEGGTSVSVCTLCTASYHLVGNTCTICPGGKTSVTGDPCTDCPVGKYGQSGVCQNCHAGQYQDDEGESSCELCPDGKTSVPGDPCTDCPVGKYGQSGVCLDCPFGNYQDDEGESSCKLCPQGTYRSKYKEDSSGAPLQWTMSNAECQEYADGVGLEYKSPKSAYPRGTCWAKPCFSWGCSVQVFIGTMNDGVRDCGSGSNSYSPYQAVCVHKVSTTSSSVNDCTSCAAGKYNDATGSAWAVACKDCNAGQYSGQQASSCTNCVAGTYSSAGATSCTNCAAGQYSSAAVATCTNCAAGTYSSAGASTCTNCAAGTYSSAGASTCTNCAAGTYSSAGASTCTNCAAGTYSSAGATSCTNCATGQFQASSGQSSCGSCAGGKYQNLNGQTSCKLCGAGKYHNNNGQTAGSSCTNCVAGKYSSAGATSCTNCAAGTYSSAAAATCTNCAAGTYSSAGATSCIWCLTGTYSSAGAASCTNCAAGTYSAAATSTSCTNCAAGTYSSAGAASCTNCAAGKYSSAAAATCTNCAAGKYASSAGSSQCTDVSRCHDGTGCSSGLGCTGQTRSDTIRNQYYHWSNDVAGSLLHKYGSSSFSTSPAGRAWTWTDADDCFLLCAANSECEKFELCSPNSCCIYKQHTIYTVQELGYESYRMNC